MIDAANLERHRQLSIIVPVYQNEKTLAELVERLNELSREFTQIKTELVLVDDGSVDSSLNTILLIQPPDHLVTKVIKLSKNFGQIAAIEAGLRYSSGDACVIISADLQDPPELIKEFVSEWEKGSDLVIAHRLNREDSKISKFFSSLAYGIARRRYKQMPYGGFDFLLMSRRIVDHYLSMNGSNRFFQGDILYLGFPLTLVPYTRLKRQEGRGSWSLNKRLKYFIDIALVSSYLPIRIVSLLGFVATITSSLYAVVIFFARLYGSFVVPGWAPLMIIVLLSSGLNLLILGLIGEYIWRIYDLQLSRPNFIVEKVLDLK